MEWCFSRNEKGKYGDQGYRIYRKMFIGIRCLKYPELILPVELFNYDFIIEGKTLCRQAQVDILHFSGYG